LLLGYERLVCNICFSLDVNKSLFFMRKTIALMWSWPFLILARPQQRSMATMTRTISFEPVGANQLLYQRHLLNESVPLVVVTGPAGTGKTMLACHAMMNQLSLGRTEKLIVTRPYVSVDNEQIGFLPGNILQKMQPWTHPVFDQFHHCSSPTQVASFLKQGTIETVPLGFMRGRTFHNTWILADEMQNSSPAQMLMLLTRLGQHSKLIVTGDLAQSDVPGLNGLQDLLQRLGSYPYDDAALVTLGTEDIQRSRIVSRLLDLYP